MFLKKIHNCQLKDLEPIIIYLEILISFESFFTQRTLVWPQVTVRDTVCSQCALGGVHTGTNLTCKLITTMILLVSIKIGLCFKSINSKQSFNIHNQIGPITKYYTNPLHFSIRFFILLFNSYMHYLIKTILVMD